VCVHHLSAAITRNCGARLHQIHPQCVPKENHHRKVLLHDNAKPRIAKETKEALLELEWKVLSHSAYSPDIFLSNYYLFRSMQHGLSVSTSQISQIYENGLIAKKMIPFL